MITSVSLLGVLDDPAEPKKSKRILIDKSQYNY